MNKLCRYIALTVLIFIALTGCSTQKWKIYQTQMSFRDELANPTEVKNTILLNTESGDTWILWTEQTQEGTVNYVWENLEKKANKETKAK